MDRRDDPWRLLARVTAAEWVVVTGSVLTVIALLLEWTSVTCSGSAVCSAEPTGGIGFRGWAWLTFAGLVVVLCLLLARKVLGALVPVPELTVPDAAVYTVMGLLELLGCALYYVEYPVVTVGPTSIRPGSGWYLAIIAAAVTVAGGRLLRRQRPPAEQLDLFPGAAVH